MANGKHENKRKIYCTNVHLRIIEILITLMYNLSAVTAAVTKARSPYASLEEARGALGTDFHWKNVRFREVGRVLSWQTRAGEWIPVDSEPSANCRRCTQKGAALPARNWHFQCPHWS